MLRDGILEGFWRVRRVAGLAGIVGSCLEGGDTCRSTQSWADCLPFTSKPTEVSELLYDGTALYSLNPNATPD